MTEKNMCYIVFIVAILLAFVLTKKECVAKTCDKINVELMIDSAFILSASLPSSLMKNIPSSKTILAKFDFAIFDKVFATACISTALSSAISEFKPDDFVALCLETEMLSSPRIPEFKELKSDLTSFVREVKTDIAVYSVGYWIVSNSLRRRLTEQELNDNEELIAALSFFVVKEFGHYFSSNKHKHP